MITELLATDPVTLGPYRLLGRLGGGGMGEVFLAAASEGLVTVKLIRPEFAEDLDFRRRFAREVAAARKVSGAYTAKLIDADTEGAVPWLATVYIAGPSLSEAVRDTGPLPAASLRELAAGLVMALRAIHAAGVVHRDLKPSNVLLADDGPRVIDFGISHAAEASAITQTGALVGSPGYMSPEQAKGHRVGPASDVFSLGALLAYAATGAAPFGEGQMWALLYRVVSGEPDLSGVPAEFRPLIERCLAKVPEERPGLDELLVALGGEPAQANWLPAALVRTLPRYAPAARIAEVSAKSLPVPGHPSVVEVPHREAWAGETALPEQQAVEFSTATATAPAREARTGDGAAPAVQHRRVKPWQLGAGIAVAAVAVGLGLWLVTGMGSRHVGGQLALVTPSTSARTSAPAKPADIRSSGQPSSTATPTGSGTPTPSPSQATPDPVRSATSPAPGITPTSSSTAAPAKTPAPTSTSIAQLSESDDPNAIAASEVSYSSGCTAWLDNDGSGNLTGTIDTYYLATCDAAVYRSDGLAVNFSASWAAERTSNVSDVGYTMWICVWQPGDQSSEACSPKFAMDGDTPTEK